MSQANVNTVAEGVSFVNLEASQRTKEAGWVPRQPFDYSDEASTWAADAQRYEWKDEYGDVGPEDPELEKMLFRDEQKMEVGEHIDKSVISYSKSHAIKATYSSSNRIQNIHVTVESETRINPIASFNDAGLHPIVLENVRRCGFKQPTPIQTYCLPALLKGLDVIGIAQTGSGKTAAYLIPTVSRLMGKAKKLCGPRPDILAPDFDIRKHGVRAEPLFVIVVPTRELATQIFDEARRLCYRSMFRPCVVYGGAPRGDQANQLRRGCDLLIATPGRLVDFLESGTLSLSRVKFVASIQPLRSCTDSERRFTIVDEADEMVTNDWSEAMAVIMGGADANSDSDHVYCLFSATFPKGARALAKRFLSTDHIRIRVGRAGSTTSNVTQRVSCCIDKSGLYVFILKISLGHLC